MENGPFEVYFLLKMGIFHGYVTLPEGNWWVHQYTAYEESESYEKGERWSHDTPPEISYRFLLRWIPDRGFLSVQVTCLHAMCYASFKPSKLVGFHDVLSGTSSINPRFLRKLAYRSVWCINLFNSNAICVSIWSNYSDLTRPHPKSR